MTQFSYNYDKRAGQELRKLRLQRGMTLEQAAQLTHISTPMLSRKERGEGEVNRETIRSAIAGYQLTMNESYRLWMAAGFLPEQAHLPSPTCDIENIAQHLLQNQPYPAFITDHLCYLQAWNESLEHIWEPSQAEHQPVHIVDDLLSIRQRQRLGAQWEQYILRLMKFFYRKTLMVAREPAAQHLLETLHSRYGDLFVTKWNQAQNEKYLSQHMMLAETAASIITHHTHYGTIQYIATINGSAVPHGYEFVVYVPVNSESQQRYQKFRTAIRENTIYVPSGNVESEVRR